MGGSPLPRLMLVTDPAHGDVAARVRSALDALPAGAAMVQLRDRGASARSLFSLAVRLRDVTTAKGALLVVSDRIDVALAVRADGVQLPELGLPVAEARALVGPLVLLGRSVHDPAGARRAAALGADYLVAAPIFEVPGKGKPLGLGGLAELCRAANMPTFALGGVTPERAQACLDAGAHGVARQRDWLVSPG